MSRLLGEEPIRRASKVLMVIALLGVLLALGARPAHTATFTVNSGADEVDANVGNGVCASAAGNCTLRAAVQEANAAADLDTINFSVSSVDLSIGGSGEDGAATGDLDIKKDVIIDGGGGGVVIATKPNFTDPNFFHDRLFHVLSYAKATLKNLSLKGGRETQGGGIYIQAISKIARKIYASIHENYRA